MTALPAGSAVHTASGAAAAPGTSPTGSFASGVSRVNGITVGFGGEGEAGVLFCATMTALPGRADSAKASTTAKVALRLIPRHHTESPMASWMVVGHRSRGLLIVAAVTLLGSAARAVQTPAGPQPAPTNAQNVELFETKIRPLLAANC